MYDKLSTFFEDHDVVPKKENARSYIFDCPACGGHEKLYIEKDTGRSVCFKHKTENCPTKKTGIIKTLHLISEVPFDVIKREMADEIISTPEEQLNFDEPVFSDDTVDEDRLLPITDEKLPFDCKLINWPDSKDGLTYLQGRGLDLDTLMKYSIMYSPYFKRVIFPVIMNNELYGWQGRAIDKNNLLKMYNLPGEWKTQSLMFFDNLKNTDFAIIAEGPVSALKFAKVGNFVATMGKAVAEKQLQLILETGIKKIYLALDPDAALEMEELVHRLLLQSANPVKCFLVKVPTGKDDFGDCSYEECKNAFENAEALDLGCYNLYSYITERM
jgi:hypothetical protein